MREVGGQKLFVEYLELTSQTQVGFAAQVELNFWKKDKLDFSRWTSSDRAK
jgi:hypothetical protein